MCSPSGPLLADLIIPKPGREILNDMISKFRVYASLCQRPLLLKVFYEFCATYGCYVVKFDCTI